MSITVSKVCARCKTDKPFTEFYVRAPHNWIDNPPTLPGHTISECIACMKERNKVRIHPTVPRAETEILAIEYLKKRGIPVLPGKAVHAADVDVVAFGCVWIEVKFSSLERRYSDQQFVFTATPAQMRRGFLAHIVMLICNYGDRNTYHLFEKGNPVFFIHGRVKSGLTFRPGRDHALKHGNNRTVMTQQMMDAAQDDIALIWRTLLKLCEDLKTSL